MLKVQIIGHIGQDAQVNIHGSESVINFSVAHTDKYKDGNGALVSKTTWVSCSWWVEKHTIAQYLKKGTQVYIEGVPEARMWKKRGTDENQCGLTCRVYKVELLGGRRDENSGSQQQSPPANTGYQPAATDISGDDDLPF